MSKKLKPVDGSGCYMHGYSDAQNGLSSLAHKYKGHYRKCYENGFKEGQITRAYEKKRRGK